MSSIITIDPTRRMTRREAEAERDAVYNSAEDMGMRMLKLRDEHGYTALGFDSFTDLTKSMGEEMSIGKIYHQMHQAEVNVNLSNALGRRVRLPMTHALALKDLEPEQQVLAFEKAIKGFKKGDPKPDEKIFQRAAKEIAPAAAAAPTKSRSAAKAKEPGWTKEEIAKDQDLSFAFTAIRLAYGAEDTNAIQNGIIPMKRADVIFLAKLPRERMLEIQDLIFATKWTPEAAIKFLNKMPEEGDPIEDLMHLCLTTKGKFWTGDFGEGGFTITCKANKAAKR